jgi:hypothetical protein
MRYASAHGSLMRNSIESGVGEIDIEVNMPMAPHRKMSSTNLTDAA